MKCAKAVSQHEKSAKKSITAKLTESNHQHLLGKHRDVPEDSQISEQITSQDKSESSSKLITPRNQDSTWS